MKTSTITRGLFAILALGGFASAAHAADGAVCWSPTVTNTNVSSNTTQTYTTLDNATKFTCNNGSSFYTIKQLAQAGWKISELGEAVLSVTTTTSGSGVVTVTTKSRFQLVIQN